MFTETPACHDRHNVSRNYLHASLGRHLIWLHPALCLWVLFTSGGQPKESLEPDMIHIFLKMPHPHLECPDISARKTKYNSITIMSLGRMKRKYLLKKLNLLRKSLDLKQRAFLPRGQPCADGLAPVQFLLPDSSLAASCTDAINSILPACKLHFSRLIQKNLAACFPSWNTPCKYVLFPDLTKRVHAVSWKVKREEVGWEKDRFCYSLFSKGPELKNKYGRNHAYLVTQTAKLHTW